MMLTLAKKPILLAALSLGLVSLACADDEGSSGESDATETSGDGNGDPAGDGDGDPAGDGDGDPTGDGDGDPGDGDGDPGDGDGDPGDGDPGDGDGDPEPDPYACIAAPWLNGGPEQVDYTGTDIELGSHCLGTNHQDIEGIERVVFIGDSVTVGSPPTPTEDFYRSRLADDLAMKFDLVAPSVLWQTANPIDGKALIKEDGDFAACAEWGARTDDYFGGGNQVAECFSGDDFDARTLVILTMGGNDVAAMAKDAIDGVSEQGLWDAAAETVQNHQDLAHWFVDDPEKFPNGVFVVYANVYEFTDATTDLLSCPAAGLAGFDQNPPDPELLIDIVADINREFALLATETQTDMVLMFENFCGHGFHADDPASPCYRGPNQEIWFDLTCIHPTADGHGELASWFFATIDE